MAYSSILGGDRAPAQPSGRSSDLLGPSDNSDSGSDALGTTELHADSDGVGTGERGAVYGPDAVEGADIAPDRVVRMDADGEELGEAVDDGPGSGKGFPEADPDGQEMTDLDADSDADADESDGANR
ncbi:hypothetical protein [Ramlibacter algicola]|uniref:Chemotaxis protein n=1 Tax=Ramlibacter algicola TaxID=2795217 RepID=A0A934PX88_9BURK|nr:hypothetical protein [Ramlibacter algicola]MBK0391018.1 hypothetical protein [Ramlibacter algicola]